jgi:surfactin synthase thioesterase subunit
VTASDTRPRLRDQGPVGGTALVCLPHAGAGASSFTRWRGLFPPSVGLVRAQLPGREDVAAEPPLQHAADAVALLLPEIAAIPRVALYGHSMGAVIAYELARALQAAGRPVVHLFVSGRRAPHLPSGRGPIHRLPDDEFAAALTAHVPAAPAFRSYALRLTRADLELSEEYRPEPGPPLACPVTAFHGGGDPIVDEWQARAWAEATSGPSAVHVFPGDHLFHQTHRAALAAIMIEELA